MSKAKSTATVAGGEAAPTNAGSIDRANLAGLASGDLAISDQGNTVDEAALTNAGSVDQGDLAGFTSSDLAIVDQGDTGSVVSSEPVIVDRGSAGVVVSDEPAVNMGAVEVIKARVLVVCEYGEPNDVVELSAALVLDLSSIVDADPAAVAYAESFQKV